MTISAIGPQTLAPTGSAARAKPAPDFAVAIDRAQSAPASPHEGLPPLFKYATNGVVTLADIEREMADLKRDLKRDLTAALKEAGIAVPPRFTLEGGAHGLVVGDHPQKAAIEKIVADHPTIGRDANHLLALANFVRRGQEAIAFQKAYMEDPQAAVARFAHLFDGMFEEHTRLVIGSDRDGLAFDFATYMGVKRA